MEELPIVDEAQIERLRESEWVVICMEQNRRIAKLEAVVEAAREIYLVPSLPLGRLGDALAALENNDE